MLNVDLRWFYIHSSSPSDAPSAIPSHQPSLSPSSQVSCLLLAEWLHKKRGNNDDLHSMAIASSSIYSQWQMSHEFFFVSTHLPINSQAAIHHRNLLIHPVPFQGERMDANWDSLEETHLCNSSSPLRCSFLLLDSLSSKPSASPSDAPSRQPSSIPSASPRWADAWHNFFTQTIAMTFSKSTFPQPSLPKSCSDVPSAPPSFQPSSNPSSHPSDSPSSFPRWAKWVLRWLTTSDTSIFKLLLSNVAQDHQTLRLWNPALYPLQT